MTTQAVERVKKVLALMTERPPQTASFSALVVYGDAHSNALAADLRAILAYADTMRDHVEALLAHTDGLHLPATAQIIRSKARSALTGEGERG